MQDFKDGPPIPRNISALQSLSLRDFRHNFSTPTNPSDHFSGKSQAHFTTNEYDYPEGLSKLRTRGGLHLAVMGGLDPVLGQLAVTNPELSIVTDINDSAIDWTIDGRLDPLLNSSNAQEYWQKVREFHRDVIRKALPNRFDIPTDQDASSGGWSSEKYFNDVKKALAAGRIKVIKANIMTDGLNIGLAIAKATGIPLRLIYLSNILDYTENIDMLPSFKEKLRKGIAEGLVDKNSQVIYVGGENGLNTIVVDINEFIQ